MTLEITERFLMMLLSVSIIFFISQYLAKNKLHPLSILVSICAFFLCLVFVKIEMSVGIGFGLFAIFSILRFRTESFGIHAIIFLFVSITLAILNILLPIEKVSTILIINIIIVVSYALMSFIEYKYLKNNVLSTEIICSSDEFGSLSEEQKISYLKERTQLLVVSYSIKSLHLIEGKIVLKVNYI